MSSLPVRKLSADYLVPVPLVDVQLVCGEVTSLLLSPVSLLMSSLSVRKLSTDYLVPVPLVDVQLVCEEVIN